MKSSYKKKETLYEYFYSHLKMVSHVRRPHFAQSSKIKLFCRDLYLSLLREEKQSLILKTNVFMT